MLAGSDPDYAVRDLFNAIAKGEYPTWTMYIQVGAKFRVRFLRLLQEYFSPVSYFYLQKVLLEVVSGHD